jgi:hypothetical protein
MEREKVMAAPVEPLGGTPPSRPAGTHSHHASITTARMERRLTFSAGDRPRSVREELSYAFGPEEQLGS